MDKPRYTCLRDWLHWQESLHGQEIDLGLARIRQVYQRMRIGWQQTRFITVGGTNGKGSCIAFLNEIYQGAGYRVGRFTSPHFLRYNERIQIDSRPVDDASLCAAFAAIDAARGDISLTYFEFSTLAALWLFARERVAVALLEVGLGGRLDASNLLAADCAIVTSIGIDHRDWLGDSREQIGYEKAGIYRSGKPAICGDEAIPASVKQHASEIGALWYGRGEQFEVQRGETDWALHYAGQCIDELPWPQMRAPVQLNNAACAVLAVQLLAEDLPVEKTALQQGIRMAQLPGRMQRWQYAPEVILDVAHNEDAAKAVVQALQGQPLHLLLGMLRDKEVQATVAALAALTPLCWHLAAPDSPRALDADSLQTQVLQLQPAAQTRVYADVRQAYRAARAAAGSAGRVLVVGSFFTVAEVMGAV